MTATSQVRVAKAADYHEVWRLLMLGHEESAIFPPAMDKIEWMIRRVIDPETIHPDDTGIRGVAGVIGPQGALEGIAIIIICSFWYTHAKHLEELIVFVDPEHRKSDHAKSLLGWAKALPETTGLPLLIGFLSNKRTEAKCKLYQRILPKVGEFFLVPPNGNGAVGISGKEQG